MQEMLNGEPEPMFRIPKIVLGLIALLAAVHILAPVFIGDWEAWSVAALSFIPLRLTHPAQIPHPAGSQYYSLLTYGLLHADYFHLITNCIWLVVFGTPVARYLGGLRFLLLISAATIAGGLATLAVHWAQMIILIGASGGVSGLIGAAIPIMYGRGAGERFRTGSSMEGFSILSFRELLTNYRALCFMAIWLGFTFFTGASQIILPTSFLGESMIAWETHLGGFLAGLACIYACARTPVSET